MASNQEIIEQLNKDLGIDKTKLDVGSITPITLSTLIEDNKNFRPNLTFGDPVINKFKKAFKFAGDIKEFILPEPKASDPLSLIDYAISSSPGAVVGKTAVKGLGKIDLDADDLDEFVEWVKSNKNEYQKKNMQTLLGRKRNAEIKNISKNYLKENDLINKDGTVTLYRYLNIAESNKLQPDKGLSSTTLNPAHAKEMAIKQSKVTGRKLKEGEKADIFDSFDPLAKMGKSKYETTTLYRKPVVLEYKVPVEKVEAYLPAVFNSIDEAGDGFNTLARMNVENSYSHLADDLVDEGYDYYDALDELKGNYGFDDIYDSIDAANKESEILIDLTDIKPKNVYSDFSEVNQIVDLDILDKLKFDDGGSVNIEDMANKINTDIDSLNKDLGISQPGKAPTTGVVTPLRPKDILNQDINISDPVLKNLMSIAKTIKDLIAPTPSLSDPLSLLDATIGNTPIGKAGKASKYTLEQLKNLRDDFIRAEKLEFDPGFNLKGQSGDLREAAKIRQSAPEFSSSDEISREISKLEGKKVISPEEFARVRKEFEIPMEKATTDFKKKSELKKYIETIPLKERLALYTDDTIPLTGKYKVLDEDVLDFYDDIIDIQKIPKNYRSGDNTLAKVFLDKKNIPARVDLNPELNKLRPKAYYEEIFDFKKPDLFDFGKTNYKEKIKLYIPKEQVGGGVKYKTKTITDPSKEEIQKLLDEI